MEEPIMIKNSKNKWLNGMLHMPDNQMCGPMVVMSHGFLGIKSAPHRLFVKMARKLTTIGIACLRFDYFGSGDSEGEFHESSISTQVDDLRSVIKYAKTQQEFQITRLGILGYSLGGCVSAIALTPTPSFVSTLVMWAPVANPLGSLTSILTEELVINGLKGNTIEFEGERISDHFIKELPFLNPVEKLLHFNEPILIVHGNNDDVVSPVSSLAYQQAFQHPLSKVIIHPEANHLFDTYSHERTLIDQTASWFDNLLQIAHV